jgi:Reverse transcriptase (RNA-dependent DNA polymerase)
VDDQAGFVSQKEATANAIKRAANTSPLEGRSKRIKTDDRHKVIQKEGADSSNGARTEGARPEGAAAPEESPDSEQFRHRGREQSQDSEQLRNMESEQLHEKNKDPLQAPNGKEGRAQKSPHGTTDNQMKQSRRVTTRLGRASKPAARWIEAMTTSAMAVVDINQEGWNPMENELLCLQSMYPDRTAEQDAFYVFKTSTDPDTMYLHQAMKEPDRHQLMEAMENEVKGQMENENFSIVSRSSIPDNEPVMPTVWQMKRKWDIITRQVKTWKARLNIDGSKMIKGVHYQESYSPVASWNSIRTMLILAAQHNWHTEQIDYVLAFPQAPIERTLYMEIPKGYELEGEHDRKDYVLQLHRNVYGSKNARRTWYQYLSKKLTEEVGFVQSKVDECVFYKGKVIYVLYTDDSIFAGPDQIEIDQAINDIQRAKLNITVEGDIQDFLGININRKEDGSVHLSQPQLIKGILKDLQLLGDQTKIKSSPAMSSKILMRHEGSEDFDKSFDYRSVVGKLNYLEKGTHADISYITHQCARFAVDPKREQEKRSNGWEDTLRATLSCDPNCQTP